MCAPFSRQAGGNLNPPQNFLDNLGDISTNGVDAKINWAGKPGSFGHYTASLQGTVVGSYKAIDVDGNVAQRQVGVEVDNSSIPKLQANLQLGWALSDWEANWSMRYIDAVTESCATITVVGVPGCQTRTDFHRLRSVLYNDVQVAWTNAFRAKGLKLALGANNVFSTEPPICYSCTLNGYDAGTYDLPGSFWNLSARYDL